MFAKHAQGTALRQAETAWPEGTFEEMHTRNGFAGDASHLYRAHPTTMWSRVEGPIRPRGIRCDDLPPEDAENPKALPLTLLRNAAMTLSVSKRRQTAPAYFRNADGDTVIIVQRGSGMLVCDYGVLDYGPYEYLVIPKGTNYLLSPHGEDNLAYIVETTGEVRIPDRGMLGAFLPFDLGVIDVPQLDAMPAWRDVQPDRDEWEIVVKRDNQLSSIYYDFDPLDVQGWQGSLTPYRLRLSDIRPVTSERMNVSPITHATFATDDVWLCTFCPRPWQSSDDAAPSHPYHRNVDYDEIIINLGSPDGPGVPGRPIGHMFLTPAGMSHGPNAAMLANRMDRLPFYLLNIDSRHALRPTPAFEKAEIPDYVVWESFSGPPRPASFPAEAGV